MPAGAASMPRRAWRPLYVAGSTFAFTGFNPSVESSGRVIALVCAPLGAGLSKRAKVAAKNETRNKGTNFETTKLDLGRFLSPFSSTKPPFTDKYDSTIAKRLPGAPHVA